MKRWRYFTHFVCPICSRGRTYWEYRNTPKPADWHDRNETIDSACGSHFI